MSAVETFLCAHQAAEEAARKLLFIDTGGWGGEHDEAGRLHAEAQAAWRPVAALIARGAELAPETLRAGRAYSNVNHGAVPMTLPWRESIGTTDWSRGRWS
jgi:hypothetical protein